MAFNDIQFSIDYNPNFIWLHFRLDFIASDYEISVQEIKDDGKYEINIIGTLNDADSPETNW